MHETFLEHMSYSYGEDDSSAFKEILAAFHLTDAQPDEWVEGNDSDLLPCSEYGLIIKTLSHQELKLFQENAYVHFMLQPLKTIVFKKSAALIFSGVQLKPKKMTVDEAIKKIKQQAYRTKTTLGLDVVAKNIGYITDNDKEHPILIDHGCIKSRDIRPDFKHASTLRIQTKYFNPVTSNLNKAWGHESLRPKNLDHFLTFCRENVALSDNNPDKRLYNGWAHLPSNYYGFCVSVAVKRAAEKYQHRHEQLNLVA